MIVISIRVYFDFSILMKQRKFISKNREANSSDEHKITYVDILLNLIIIGLCYLYHGTIGYALLGYIATLLYMSLWTLPTISPAIHATTFVICYMFVNTNLAVKIFPFIVVSLVADLTGPYEKNKIT